MHPEVAHLLDLQEIDQEMLDLQDQLNRYPGVWDEIKEELRRKTAALEHAEASDRGHQSDRRRIEAEIRTGTEKIRRYQEQQMQLRTSKEVSTLSTQIEALKESIARLEEQGLALIQRDEDVRKRVEECRKALEGAKERAKVERERIRSQVNTKKERLEILRVSRDKMAPTVPPQALELYERIKKRWAANPVVPARHGSCAGCNFSLLPNVLVAVHRAGEIVCCDNCGRILSQDDTAEVVPRGA